LLTAKSSLESKLETNLEVAQMAEYLPSKHEALSADPSTAKNKTKKLGTNFTKKVDLNSQFSQLSLFQLFIVFIFLD
jgi:hypothetical protein